MTTERRLERVEAALSPREATLLWLEEAQCLGSLPAYVDWLIDQPPSAAPLWRVPAQAEAAVVRTMRNARRVSIEAAARRVTREAIFLVELVLHINEAAGEMTRIGGQRFAISFWEMRALSLEAQVEADGIPARGLGTAAERVRWWRDGILALTRDLHAGEEARGLLEGLYLDGHAALFPEAAQDHLSLREQVERLAGVGTELLDPFDHRDRPTGPARELDLDEIRAAARGQAPELAAQVASAAQCATLDVLGNHDAAAALVERRLRATGG